jgi:hypothetical protein
MDDIEHVNEVLPEFPSLELLLEHVTNLFQHEEDKKSIIDTRVAFFLPILITTLTVFFSFADYKKILSISSPKETIVFEIFIIQCFLAIAAIYNMSRAVVRTKYRAICFEEFQPEHASFEIRDMSFRLMNLYKEAGKHNRTVNNDRAKSFNFCIGIYILMLPGAGIFFILS